MNSAYFSGLMPTRPASTGLGGLPKNSYLGQMAQVNQPTGQPTMQQAALPPVPGQMPQQMVPPTNPFAAPQYQPMIPGREQTMRQPQQMKSRGALPQQPYTPIFRMQETM